MNKRHKKRSKTGKFRMSKIKKLWRITKTLVLIALLYTYFKPALIEIWNNTVPAEITMSLHF